MRFVTYLGVSTDRQGRSGLSFETQRKAVADHVLGKGPALQAGQSPGRWLPGRWGPWPEAGCWARNLT